MTQNKRIEVFSCEQYNDAWPPIDLVDFSAWLEGHLQSIPTEFRESATITFDAQIGYDGPYIDLEIAYRRPETKEETEERERSERHRESLIESVERKELNRLQEKYTDQTRQDSE